MGKQIEQLKRNLYEVSHLLSPLLTSSYPPGTPGDLPEPAGLPVASSLVDPNWGRIVRLENARPDFGATCQRQDNRLESADSTPIHVLYLESTIQLSDNAFLLFLWYLCHLLFISSGLSLANIVISSSSRAQPLPSLCLSQLVNGLITSLLFSAFTAFTFLTPHCPTTRFLSIHFLRGRCRSSQFQPVFLFLILRRNYPPMWQLLTAWQLPQWSFRWSSTLFFAWLNEQLNALDLLKIHPENFDLQPTLPDFKQNIHFC